MGADPNRPAGIPQPPQRSQIVNVLGPASHSTRCRLRVWPGINGAPLVVVTELALNPGPSVTNAAERIWWRVAEELETHDFTLVEHYGPESYPGSGAESFDIVTLAPGERTPCWRRISSRVMRAMVRVEGPCCG